MINKKVMILCIFCILNIFILNGCWSYREMDKLAIVGGMAIDKGKNDNYLITAEIVDLETDGGEVKVKSKKIRMEGESVFDAIRNIIKISAKKLYWAHTKAVIVSKDIAKEDITQVIDLINRDAEIRLSLNILVSKEETARELLSQQSVTTEIRTFEIEEVFKGQKSLGKSPDVDVSDFINALSGEGISAVLPSISVVTNEGQRTSSLSGTAVFKRDKLVDFLDGEETKSYLFIIDKINSGLIIYKYPSKVNTDKITLEILENKTKMEPQYKDNNLIMNININTKVAVGEQGTDRNYVHKDGLETIKNGVQRVQKKKIEELIRKVQMEYNADIFGFGKTIKEEMPNLWKEIGSEWDELFRTVDTKVSVSMDIKNSGLSPKVIEVGD
ncbi:Ger(x)C family spore germination protein [Clostridiisalibacter paucivorans]|uniref:Ger(x)C family spore germination protein n=1 Tax=Clostridiisalibacter paucivorans TaxID=408753 RepID=UPI00047BFC70|nr:Ger(x)C family spore germination protein [Clostridiisalibacter paucivorans]